MAVAVLIVLAAALAYAARAYAFPFRPCRRCGGSGRKKGSARRRPDLCSRCGGTGRVHRPGAPLLHRTVLDLRTYRTRQRQRRDAARTPAPPRNPVNR
jgi:hypothetical protein